jgi:hypothetical protein
VIALLLSFASAANAEVVTIEVTIKAVDATGRTVTATRKSKTIELDVSRKAKVTINGKAGALDALAAGQTAKIDYHTDLEIITKIEAFTRGEGQVELLELSELNERAHASSSWLSPDGLTIYWDRGDWGTSGVIWTAHRKDADSFFREKQQLFPGRSPTVTADGLQMIFLGTRSDGEKGASLHFTTRNAIDEPFKRPREIQALQGVQRPMSPFVSSDGLKLYFNQGGGATKKPMEIVVCSREDNGAPWSEPKQLPILLDEIKRGVLTGVFITRDELSMYCAIEGRGKDQQQDNLMLWTRTSKSKPFSTFTYLNFVGLPRMSYFAPRYVKATNELFVSRAVGQSQLGLYVIKKFKPPSAPE